MAGEDQMNRGAAVSSQAQTSGGSSQLATRTSTPGRPVAGGEMLNETKKGFWTLKQDIDDYIRKNPAKAVFTAIGIGFVLGLMRHR